MIKYVIHVVPVFSIDSFFFFQPPFSHSKMESLLKQLKAVCLNSSPFVFPHRSWLDSITDNHSAGIVSVAHCKAAVVARVHCGVGRTVDRLCTELEEPRDVVGQRKDKDGHDVREGRGWKDLIFHSFGLCY